MAALTDDLNLPRAYALMHELPADELAATGALLGFFTMDANTWFRGTGVDDGAIAAQVAARIAAKAAKNWAEADRIRDALKAQGIVLEDRPDGTTDWRQG
jgi:cysteinyl-tRNA synthetase